MFQISFVPPWYNILPHFEITLTSLPNKYPALEKICRTSKITFDRFWNQKVAQAVVTFCHTFKLFFTFFRSPTNKNWKLAYFKYINHFWWKHFNEQENQEFQIPNIFGKHVCWASILREIKLNAITWYSKTSKIYWVDVKLPGFLPSSHSFAK